MSTQPNPETDGSQTEQIPDGPASEPGAGGDRGATSQDQPADTGERAEARPEGEPADMERKADVAFDSNEKGDERATIVGPDGTPVDPPV